MSLLMQALKKAEHAKKKHAAAESHTPRQKSPAPTTQDDGDISGPATAATERPQQQPQPQPQQSSQLSRSSRARASAPSGTSDDARREPTLGLTEIEPAQPALALQLLALPAPDHEPAEVQSPIPEALPFQHAPAPEPQLEPVGRFAAQAAEAPAKTDRTERAEPTEPTERPGSPRADIEQKQAAAQAAGKINQARQQAKAVFASKQPPRSRRAVLIAGSGMIVAILCAGAVFYYWQTGSPDSGMARNGMLQAHSPAPVVAPAASPPANPSVAMATPQPVPEPATAVSRQAEVAKASPPVAPPVAGKAGPNSAQASAQAATLTPADEEKPGRSGGRSRAALSSNEPLPPARRERNAAARQKPHADPVAADDDIQIYKSIAPEAINSALTNAYRLFSSGDLNAARPLYESVLHSDPNNRDALLGLAAIALNQNQTAQAGTLYSRLLDLDPSDPEATAGLSSMRRGDPQQSESLLKKVLAQNPQSGASLFELGNLYARQSRWAEAEQVYFRAYGTASGNADYAYNLAISLDRLGQNKLALEYYQRALALAKDSFGNFNRSAAQSRIDQLQQVMLEKHLE